MARDKHTEIVKLRLEVATNKHTIKLKLSLYICLDLQYDSKLLKLQKSNAVKSQTGSSSHFNSDIFRKVCIVYSISLRYRIDTIVNIFSQFCFQKLQAAKSEAAKEIGVLKEKISHLERQLSMASQPQHDFRSNSLSLKRRRINQNL